MFFYLGAAILAGELISGPAVYYLMEINTWIPVWSGLGCLGLSTIVSRFVPETLSKSEAAPESPTGEPSRPAPGMNSNQTSGLRYIFRPRTSKLYQAVAWFTKMHLSVTALLFTLLVTTFGRFAQELLSQYVTKRYSWSWSQVRAIS